MKNLGRIDNVLALYAFGDKANVLYESLSHHDFTLSKLRKSEKYYEGDDFTVFHQVPVFKVDTKFLSDTAYLLMDLPKELLSISEVSYLDSTGHIVPTSHPAFILTDGESHLFAFPAGYEYARFKALVDKNTATKIKKLAC